MPLPMTIALRVCVVLLTAAEVVTSTKAHTRSATHHNLMHTVAEKSAGASKPSAIGNRTLAGPASGANRSAPPAAGAGMHASTRRLFGSSPTPYPTNRIVHHSASYAQDFRIGSAPQYLIGASSPRCKWDEFLCKNIKTPCWLKPEFDTSDEHSFNYRCRSLRDWHNGRCECMSSYSSGNCLDEKYNGQGQCAKYACPDASCWNSNPHDMSMLPASIQRLGIDACGLPVKRETLFHKVCTGLHKAVSIVTSCGSAYLSGGTAVGEDVECACNLLGPVSTTAQSACHAYHTATTCLGAVSSSNPDPKQIASCGCAVADRIAGLQGKKPNIGQVRDMEAAFASDPSQPVDQTMQLTALMNADFTSEPGCVCTDT